MRRCVALVVAGIGLFGSAITAQAQEPPRLGIVMGYPASAGMVWQAAERVSIRPTFGFARDSSDTRGEILGLPVETAATGWQVTLGVAGLIYLSGPDTLRPYVVPGYTYLRGRNTTDPGAGRGFEQVVRASGHGVSGSVGAEYRAHERMRVFAELGLEHLRMTLRATPSLGIDRTEAAELHMRTAVGLVVHF